MEMEAAEDFRPLGGAVKTGGADLFSERKSKRRRFCIVMEESNGAASVAF